MGYTFEEVQTFVDAQGPAIVSFTILRTQGDGRAGYLVGQFSTGVAPATEFVDAQAYEAFSDRTRSLNVDSRQYVQPFDYFERNSTLDPTGVKFRRLGPGRYELEITFSRWSPTSETLQMFNYARTRVYTGAGPPIGQSRDFALLVLSLDSVIPVIN